MRKAETCPLDVRRQSQLGATVYILMGVCRLQPFKTLRILFPAISIIFSTANGCRQFAALSQCGRRRSSKRGIVKEMAKISDFSDENRRSRFPGLMKAECLHSAANDIEFESQNRHAPARL
jgi:hypothetical protein